MIGYSDLLRAGRSGN